MSHSNSSDYGKAITAINALQAEERVKLRAHLTALLSLSDRTPKLAKPQEQRETKVDVILNELITFLYNRGLFTIPVSIPLITRMSSRLTPSQKQKCDDLWKFVSKHAKGRLQRLSLLRLCFECLMDSLTWMSSVSYRQVLDSLDKVPSAVDDSFPGYARFGLLRAVIADQAATNRF